MTWLEKGTLVKFNENCNQLNDFYNSPVGKFAVVVGRSPGYGGEIYELLYDGEVIDFHKEYFDVFEVK